MTIDNYLIITFYNINTKLWIFDSFCPKLFNNHYLTLITFVKKKILVVWNHKTTQIKQKKYTKYIPQPDVGVEVVETL